MVEVMKMMATSFKTSCAHTAVLSAPTMQQATADPSLCRRLWTLTGKCGSVSCRVTAPFSWILVHTRFCLCPPRVYFPVLCKFWRLYGGVNGDLLQEGLCHTQVYCTLAHECPGVSCIGAGLQWPAAGLGALSVAVGPFGRGCHYLHYLHHSLASGK